MHFTFSRYMKRQASATIGHAVLILNHHLHTHLCLEPPDQTRQFTREHHFSSSCLASIESHWQVTHGTSD